MVAGRPGLAEREECAVNRFDQVVGAFDRLKGGVAWLWFALCASLIGLLGCLSQTLYMGSLVWVATGGSTAFILVRRRQLASRARRAEIAARADQQNRDYLAGLPSGIYGQFGPS